MPRDEELTYIEMTDFTVGVWSNNNLAGGVNITSDNPCKADPSNTFRCIALPTGGLGPLPRLQQSDRLTTIPESGVAGITYQVAGFNTWGRVLPSPATDASADQTEVHVVLYYDYDDGTGFDADLYWLRERQFDTTPTTETIYHVDLEGSGHSGPRYAYLLKTRMNPTTPDDPGIPVMVCMANRVANNDLPIYRAFPDPASANILSTVAVLATDADSNAIAQTYNIAAAHQGRIIAGQWRAADHGPGGDVLITNETFFWTETNDNVAVSNVGAQFIPELDQSVTDLAPMSANSLLVIKWYGGGYVLQGDLSDVTVVQLPNLPCPDGSDWVRGVNTSRGYIYSAGPAGMYLWNGGDGAEPISRQLDGEFAVGSNFITGANGQCDRWMDRVLVPQNWVWDANMQSWWRIADPATVNIRFWSTVAYSAYAYGAAASFTAASPNFMHRFQYTDLAYTWVWKSHPLWTSQARRMEVRQGTVALQGRGTVTITIIDDAGGTSAETFTINHTNIRNYRWDISLDAENLIVQIEASGNAGGGAGTAEAPLVHRLFLGYKTAQHLRNSNTA